MRDVVSKHCHFRLLLLWGVAHLSVVTFATPLVQVRGPLATAPATQTSEPAFKLRVQKNVVIVRVVVRDKKGRAIGGLRKEDFRISDNRQPQVISSLSVETSEAAAAPARPSAAITGARAGQGSVGTPVAPLSYLAFYFDDLYSANDSIYRSREAAEKFIAGLPSTERVAIFTSSGTRSLDFTGDRQKLHEGLEKLRANKRFNRWGNCPEISDYLASQIVNVDDGVALGILGDQVINDCHMPRHMVTPESLRMQARVAYDAYVMQARAVITNLDGVIERIAVMPGERQVMLVSDGFMPLEMQDRLESVVDHALRARVTISALDGAGLTLHWREVDASQHYAPTGNQAALSNAYEGTRGTAASGTLAEIANGTGGQFFYNNNDLLSGLRKILLPPEVSYVLTFSPEELKYDGAFHTVKVALLNGHSLKVQFRKGYFAPKQQISPEELAKDQIREAVFSPDPIQDLPLTVQTEVRKAEGQNAEIAVQAQLDVRNLPFQKRGDRNSDNLTFAVALFDHNGKYVSGSQQNFALALKDATLADLQRTGLSYKTHVLVKAGAYTVRVVVRDSQGEQMAASSKAVEAPL
ncbi:MAG: VWA domain-containing protein [Terriglobia bacterium]